MRTLLGFPPQDDLNVIDVIVGRIKCVHFFAVEKHNQTSYAYHTDCLELVDAIAGFKLQGKKAKVGQLGLFGIRSVVVQLGACAPTAMYVHGADRHSVYSGQGAAKMFHGSCIHASLPWLSECDEHVWKVSMFWLPADLGFAAEVPRG